MRIERLHALADGVFAIALTLLVLELPRFPGSEDLGHDLLEAWPSYAAYAVSFVTIAIVWINHSAQLSAVSEADRTLVELVLLMLLFVSLVPWPTGLVAEHLQDAGQARPAAVVYGLVMTGMSGAFLLVWLRLARRPDLLRDEHRTRVGRAVRRSLVGPVVYSVGTVVAAVEAWVAVGLFAALAGYFALSGRRGAVRLGSAGQEGSPSGRWRQS